MSVLSSDRVIELMRAREIYISPLLSDKQIGPASIDLRLGNVALIVRARGLSHVDPKNYRQTSEQPGHQGELQRRQKQERHEVPFHRQLLLHPGTLTLVPTLEWVKLSPNLKGVVTARSSWAREGLSIATATFINPGYNGIITLELANFGQIPIAIYPGMRIAQIAFYEVVFSEAVNESSQSKLKSQFDLSFEPRSGEIAKYDDPFIPPDR